MRVLIFLSLILLITSVSSKDIVKHLTVPSVDSLVARHPNLVVLYMKEHPLCEKIDTAYRSVAPRLSAKHSLEFYVAMYEENPQIFEAFGLEAVPEIVVYKNRIKLDCNYNGLYQHSEEQLTEWIEEKFGDSLKRIDKLESSNVSKVIDVGCKREQELLQISITDNHNQYYCSQQHIGNHSEGNLILVTLNQVFTYDNSLPILEWIRTYQDRYLKPLTDYYIHKLFNSKQSHVILLTHLDKDSVEILPVFEQYARKHTNSTLSFIHSHIMDNLQLQVETLNFIGFTPEYPYPHISFLNIENTGNLQKYYPGKINKQNLTEWLDKAINLQETPFVKNSDYELKQQPSSFSSIGHNQLMNITVLADKKSPMFIYFYSEYCEQCVLRLGDLKHDLAINKSDAKHYYKYSITDNDIPFFVDVESVPTLIKYGEDESVLYLEEEHTVNNMVEFVRSNNKDIIKRNNTLAKNQTKKDSSNASEKQKYNQQL